MSYDSDNETDKAALVRNIGMLAVLIAGMVGYSVWKGRQPTDAETSESTPLPTAITPQSSNPGVQGSPTPRPTPTARASRSSFSKLVIGENAVIADEGQRPMREWLEKLFQVNGLTPEPAHLPKDRWMPFAKALVAKLCGSADQVSNLELQSLARDLAPVGREHPVSAYALGTVLMGEPGSQELLQSAFKAVDGKVGEEVLAFRVAMALAVSLSGDEGEKEAEVRIEAAFKALRKVLDATEGFSKLHDRVAVYMLRGGTAEIFFQYLHERVAEEVGKTDAAKPWLKKWIAGQHSLRRAWDERGDSYADGVSSSGMAVFAHESEKARKLFQEAWELKPETPEPAVSMIEAALSQGEAQAVKSMFTWLEEAQKVEVDTPEAARHLLWGLRPRWHGSLEKMRSFGLACAETQRYDSGLPWVLLQAHRDFSSEWDVPAEYFKELSPSHYSSAKAVFDGAEAEVKRAPWRAVDRTHAAVFAFKCRHYDEAAEWLKKLDQKPNRYALEQWEGVDEALLVGKTNAYVDGGVGAQLQRAETAEKSFNAADAVKNYEIALSEGGEKLKGAGRDYVEHRLALSKIESAARSGEAASLVPAEPKFRGWSREGGGWELDVGAWLHRGRDAWRTTVCEARIGPQFTLEGEVEVTDPGEATQCWFSYGYPDTGRWVAIRFVYTEKEVRAMLSNRLGPALEQPKITVEPRFTFKLTSSTSGMSLWVNDKPVFENAPTPPGYVKEQWSHVGIGAGTHSEKTRVRIHKLSVRR
ncbi:MAG: hypothetical protein IPK32_07715 [Verrucomicrobiaceae bacterium]|nr:hypothetical protein [Verrucomicrobiaceae bacterium]